MKRHLGLGLTIALLGMGLAGCSHESSEPLAGIQPSSDRGHFAIETIAGHAEGATTSSALYEDVTGLLPNTLYDDGPGPAFPLTDMVVKGHVIDVTPGFGFAAGDDAAGGHQVGFDDNDAVWRTFHATVQVDEVVGTASGVSAPQTVIVGFTAAATVDEEEFASSLLALPESVFFLYTSQVYSYDSNVFAVRDEGSVLLTVESKKLEAPATDEDSAADLLATTDTFAELMDAAAAPTETVAFEPLG